MSQSGTRTKICRESGGLSISSTVQGGGYEYVRVSVLILGPFRLSPLSNAASFHSAVPPFSTLSCRFSPLCSSAFLHFTVPPFLILQFRLFPLYLAAFLHSAVPPFFTLSCRLSRLHRPRGVSCDVRTHRRGSAYLHDGFSDDDRRSSRRRSRS